MYKVVKEQPLFGKRPVTHKVMFCDGCGKRITYSSSMEYGKHLCEKCFKQQKEKGERNCSYD